VKDVTIYTDGACSGNPGPGGWGAVLIYGDKRKELSGGEASTTNQRMEITAALEALKALKAPCRIRLYSDSAYLINAFRQGWLNRWQRNGWQTINKEPVKNEELWRELLQAASPHRIEWLKVKGHSDNAENNRCDELARAAIKRPVPVASKSDHRGR